MKAFRPLMSAAMALALFAAALPAQAGETVTLDLGSTPPAQVGAAVKMIVVLTLLSLAPAILLAATSFVRISIVFSFLRTALGLQNAPPAQVLTGLALFMTIAIMAPVGSRLYAEGLEPYFDGRASATVALARGAAPLREFLLKQTRESDLAVFYDATGTARPERPEDVPLHLLVPSFIVSELRTGFEMGFTLFLPFLVIDIAVASILMAMGMVMLPPSLVSLPLKVLLFVVADGWNLLVGSLLRSFT
jgi:flagellar biosynthetic protein FliP